MTEVAIFDFDFDNAVVFASVFLPQSKNISILTTHSKLVIKLTSDNNKTNKQAH